MTADRFNFARPLTRTAHRWLADWDSWEACDPNDRRRDDLDRRQLSAAASLPAQLAGLLGRQRPSEPAAPPGRLF